MNERRLPARTGDQPSPPTVPAEPNVVISWLKELVRQARLAWRLFWDPRVPWWTKTIPPATLLYIFSPVDILPDVALGLGQLDDIAIFLLGVKLFVELCPTDLVHEHLKALGAKIEEWPEEEAPEAAPEIIEGEFQVTPPLDDSTPTEE
jgi:uncharacterized membrane protein YkvA (DUF1232 family)